MHHATIVFAKLGSVQIRLGKMRSFDATCSGGRLCMIRSFDAEHLVDESGEAFYDAFDGFYAAQYSVGSTRHMMLFLRCDAFDGFYYG
jgi:hypothetical protein